MPHFPMRRAAAAIALLVVGLLAAPAAGATSTPGPAFQDEGDAEVIDLTFPLPEGSGYHYSDTYTASRSGGRLHRATDIMADKMVPIHAVADGEICRATGIDEPMPSYGYALYLCGDDGFEYVYIHINNDTPGTDDGMGGVEHAYAAGLEEGVRVSRGDHIAWVGDSGNAESTGAHLHFEIVEAGSDDVRRNPYASLVAAEERGDYPDAPAPVPPSRPAPQDSGDELADDDDGDGDTGSAGGGPTSYTRLAGETRLQTAVALSEETRTTARAVVVVPADSHVEALVAAPLAGLIGAPVLLSGPDGLAEGVAAEVRRLRPTSAYVVGTTSQLSGQVERDLEAAGVQYHARLSAPDRYALSALVAEEVMSYPEVGHLDEVILALGDAVHADRAWPDALSASALAATTATPILLVEGDRLPDPVADLLTQQRPAHLTVVGGVAAISDVVAEEAAEVADADVRRLAGDTRYATSVAVAEAAVLAGLDAGEVWVATGRNFPDALAAGPAAAWSGSPLVLVDGLVASGAPAASDWLAEHADALVVVGGESVISDAVADALTG